MNDDVEQAERAEAAVAERERQQAELHEASIDDVLRRLEFD